MEPFVCSSFDKRRRKPTKNRFGDAKKISLMVEFAKAPMRNLIWFAAFILTRVEGRSVRNSIAKEEKASQLLSPINVNVFPRAMTFNTHNLKDGDDVDTHLPLLHFVPSPHNWMNDPNGLFYDPVHGLYHLMYQYLTPRVWGHAVSKVYPSGK
jgi:hypothetical protein